MTGKVDVATYWLKSPMGEYMELLRTDPASHKRFIKRFIGDPYFQRDIVDHLAEHDPYIIASIMRYHRDVAGGMVGPNEQAGAILSLGPLGLTGMDFCKAYEVICDNNAQNMLMLGHAIALDIVNDETFRNCLQAISDHYGRHTFDFDDLKECIKDRQAQLPVRPFMEPAKTLKIRHSLLRLQ